MKKSELTRLIKLRNKFIKDFGLSEVQKMEIDKYCSGRGKDTFCYRLEYELKDLGNNSGTPAQKFGVWYGKDGKDTQEEYRYTKKFGSNPEDAFQHVKNELVNLISLEPKSQNGKDTILSSKFAPLVLGKILYLYHFEDFIPVYSFDDMRYFIVRCGGKVEKKENILTLQSKLFECKQRNEETQNMDNLEFSKWLYSEHNLDPDDNADHQLKRKVNKSVLVGSSENFKGYKPSEKNRVKKVDGIEIYPRNPRISRNALALANHKCEFSDQHESFFRKEYDIRYMEAHHLIPLKFHADFETSLDVEANIVSLCSECHNKLHYGRDVEEILTKLYKMHVDNLRKSNIDITLEKLFEYYGVRKK